MDSHRHTPLRAAIGATGLALLLLGEAVAMTAGEPALAFAA